MIAVSFPMAGVVTEEWGKESAGGFSSALCMHGRYDQHGHRIHSTYLRGAFSALLLKLRTFSLPLCVQPYMLFLCRQNLALPCQWRWIPRKEHISANFASRVIVMMVTWCKQKDHSA